MKIKVNTKIIIIVIIITSILVVSISLILKKGKNKGLELVKFNPVEVVQMKIKLPNSANTITIEKDKENEWYVSEGEQKYKADIRVISNYLNNLLKIKPTKLITKKKREWEKYQVTEQEAIKIKLFNRDKTELLDILIGKSTYQKPANPLLEDVISKTYVRLSGERAVYITNGMFQMHLNRNLNDWRKKLLTNFKTKAVQKISFIYQNEQFIIHKEDSGWYLGDKLLDKEKVERYIAKTHYINGSHFKNDFVPSGDPECRLLIETMDSTINIECYKIDENKYIIHSSQNKEAYFESDKNGLMKKLFKSLDDLQ